jgi:hypothetical protein
VTKAIFEFKIGPGEDDQAAYETFLAAETNARIIDEIKAYLRQKRKYTEEVPESWSYVEEEIYRVIGDYS